MVKQCYSIVGKSLVLMLKPSFCPPLEVLSLGLLRHGPRLTQDQALELIRQHMGLTHLDQAAGSLDRWDEMGIAKTGESPWEIGNIMDYSPVL